ncbi:MAG: tetratricopeptide repeat protein [Candidatus Polarisedimenticolia bacterium]
MSSARYAPCAGMALAMTAWLGAACAGTAPPRAGAVEAFSEANELYAASRYDEAIEKYRSLVSQGVRSEAVHFNLGNALYKTNRLGPAILEYERAARLAPLDEDVQANLHLARSMTADKASEAGARTPSFFLDRLLELTSVDQDALAFLAIYLTSGLLWAMLIAAGSQRLRRSIVAALIVLAIPLVISGASFGWKVYRTRALPQAVVLRERVDVLSAPGEGSVTLFTVHEGLKVDVRQRQGAWWRVHLDNGLNGWVPSDTLEAI